MNCQTIEKELYALANSTKAKHSAQFFKTQPGSYGAGDLFLGITVPAQRKIAKKYLDTPLNEVKQLLQNPYHEIRLTALMLLVYKYEKYALQREAIYNFYLSNLKYVNNWDLVDTSAYKIAGLYLLDKDRSVLTKLAQSSNLWDRRVAIIATFHFIKNNDFSTTLHLAKLLLHDQEDLMHKAVGWMLREVGNRDQAMEKQFLDEHYKVMPRTMLRYAIEKFTPAERKHYLNK